MGSTVLGAVQQLSNRCHGTEIDRCGSHKPRVQLSGVFGVRDECAASGSKALASVERLELAIDATTPLT